MFNLHTFLSDAGTAIGAATGIAALLRIDELWLMLRSRTRLTAEVLQLRADKKEALVTIDEQNRGHAALYGVFQSLEAKVALLEKRVDSLQPAFDGAIAYIHALTAWGLRLVRALREHRIEVGIDENLPKPPNVLTEYVPEANRPPE